ncbi:S-Ena type endospore appendage [Bacillus toyonensis]|uniref:S-Ena type endospore appendage n=1 Tax=Bacillus toyonensis TaxID=155322 RepID=UPI0027E0B89D|nr:S-Ena type endospore appendage [Bacillus toyonensis]
MCGSQGINGNCGCCPPAQNFQEKICGNFNSGATGVVNQIVWTAPAGDFFEGTFEIFNSATSAAAVTGIITSSNPTPPPATITTNLGPVPSGFSVSATISRPISFGITAPIGTNGTYCITLYKHVLA